MPQAGHAGGGGAPDAAWETTSSLLRKLRDFDEQTAWGLLVEHFRRALVNLGRRMGLADHEAEDAAQETLADFARAFRDGRYDARRGRLKTWLFGIAHHRVLRALQGARRQRRVVSADLELVEGASEASQSASRRWWEEEWRTAVYERCLAQVRAEVRPDTFEVFRRFAMEGRSAQDVAEHLGIPRTRVYNVKLRVGRRLAELARRYEDA